MQWNISESPLASKYTFAATRSSANRTDSDINAVAFDMTRYPLAPNMDTSAHEVKPEA